MRILVTHRLAYLKKSEKVLYLEKGKESKFTSKRTLRTDGVNMANGKLLRSYY